MTGDSRQSEHVTYQKILNWTASTVIAALVPPTVPLEVQ